MILLTIAETAPHMQVSAFKDYTPGSGGGAAAPAAATEEPEEDKEDDSPVAESSGGDFPPHTVMGLPALSPTMSQGVPLAGHTVKRTKLGSITHLAAVCPTMSQGVASALSQIRK